MKKVFIGFILAVACTHAETITLSAVSVFSETDLSRPLILPYPISAPEYFRAAIINLPQNAQVVISFGNDLNRDGTLDAEEVEATLNSDENTAFRLPNGESPLWNMLRVTVRGASESVIVRVGVSVSALKITLF